MFREKRHKNLYELKLFELQIDVKIDGQGCEICESWVKFDTMQYASKYATLSVSQKCCNLAYLFTKNVSNEKIVLDIASDRCS